MRIPKFLKSFTTIILAELIAVGLLAAPAVPVLAEEPTDPIVSNLISSEFEYFVGNSVFFYDDAYFNRPAYEYDQSFATTSLCLAMAAFNAPGGKYPQGYRCAEDMMKKMGIENI